MKNRVMHTWVVILDAQIQAQSMQQEVEYVLGASVYFIQRLWAINEDCRSASTKKRDCALKVLWMRQETIGRVHGRA